MMNSSQLIRVVFIAEAASASASLRFILCGALIVIHCILAYTLCFYRVFRAKVQDLRYA